MRSRRRWPSLRTESPRAAPVRHSVASRHARAVPAIASGRDSRSLRFEKSGFEGALKAIEASAYRNEADHLMDNYSLAVGPGNVVGQDIGQSKGFGTLAICVNQFTMMKTLAVIAFLASGSISAMGGASAATCRPVCQCDSFGCYCIGDYCRDWFGCCFSAVW